MRSNFFIQIVKVVIFYVISEIVINLHLQNDIINRPADLNDSISLNYYPLLSNDTYIEYNLAYTDAHLAYNHKSD